PRRDFHGAFQTRLEDFAARVRPDLILISAGFDAHRLDPVGSLGLEIEDFAAMTDFVAQLARHYCSGRIISALEGGYNVEMLPHCVAAHLERLLAHSTGSATSPASE